VAQGKILYPQARFEYAYPKAAIRVEETAKSWIEQTSIPTRSIREFHTWPVPMPMSRLEPFAGGEHVVMATEGKYGANDVHFWDFVVVLSPKEDYAFKIETAHHRTAVWGVVHAWRFCEWGGSGDAIPAEFPVWAMYEFIHAGVESGRGVYAKTDAFRISHLRVDGAGEEFIGEVSDYLGAGEDEAGRTGLRFRRRHVNFAVDVTLRGGEPFVAWSRGPRGGRWRDDPVHGMDHVEEWRTQVNELYANPPPVRPRESEYFCLLGSSKRGMQAAQVSSILDFGGWSKRRAKGQRPQHVFADQKKLAFTPMRGKRTGFVKRRGTSYVFVCKELAIDTKLEVPQDLEPLLAAWVDNFPR
jgi:hypothetical protein